MVGPVDRNARISQTKGLGKAGVPKLLKEMKTKISEFVLGRGQVHFGAGKPASFSDTPPRTGKRVSQAVSGTLTPAKPTRRK